MIGAPAPPSPPSEGRAPLASAGADLADAAQGLVYTYRLTVTAPATGVVTVVWGMLSVLALTGPERAAVGYSPAASTGSNVASHRPQMIGPTSRTDGATRMRRPQAQRAAWPLLLLVRPPVPGVCSERR